MPLISIIMPSYLGSYKNAAKDRPNKLIRAVNSVLNQTFTDWELIIIADGCEKTKQIITENFSDTRINLFYINKQPIMSGIPRNTGINIASGEWICYLDSDDMFGENHLQIIKNSLKGDWIWFNDLCFVIALNQFLEVFADIKVRGKCGTSTICHKKELNVKWHPEGNYLQDWYFIQHLI